MDELTLSRLRLWLSSEKAMGLHSLPVRCETQEASPADVAPVVAASAATQPVEVARPAAAGAVPRMTPAIRLPQAHAAAAPVVAAAARLAAVLFDRSFDAPVLARDEKARALAELDEQQVRSCPRCRLAQTRTQTVFGEGDPDAQVFFIGEGPGEKEDLSGRPFVGPAGHKLDEMIGAMGLSRAQVYIANVVKCRPPGNRAPAPDETETCTPFLDRQIEIVRPRVIVTLGLPATRFITRTEQGISRVRGQWFAYRGIKVMPTFHPAYILRNYTRETRAAVWSDLQKVMAELGLKPMKQAATAGAVD